jgi:hypothetical protein
MAGARYPAQPIFAMLCERVEHAESCGIQKVQNGYLTRPGAVECRITTKRQVLPWISS